MSESESDTIVSLTDIEDYNEVLIDEDVLKQAYPLCSSGRIKKERELQASYYIMSKYLRKNEANQKAQKSEKSEKAASLECHDGEEKLSVSVKSGEDAFKEFICPLCMKLIYKCVTTLCGHSYCEGCLDDYLMYKMVSSCYPLRQS